MSSIKQTKTIIIVKPQQAGAPVTIDSSLVRMASQGQGAQENQNLFPLHSNFQNTMSSTSLRSENNPLFLQRPWVNSLQAQNQFFIPPNLYHYIAMVPILDRTTNYYHEFWNQYYKNEVILQNFKEQSSTVVELKASIQKLELKCNQQSNLKDEKLNQSKGKKNRRVASEIAKQYACPYDNCVRNYGTEVSLNLHIKLKHGGGNKTERQKQAVQYSLASQRGEQLPTQLFNFPPGYLKEISEKKIIAQMSAESKKQEQQVDEEVDEGLEQSPSISSQNSNLNDINESKSTTEQL